MANGKPQDHPVTDTVIHGLHPFPPDLEDSVRQVHTRNPGVFNDLGNHVAAARVLLKGLLEHHGHPEMCRQFVRAYEAATGTGDRNA